MISPWSQSSGATGTTRRRDVGSKGRYRSGVGYPAKFVNTVPPEWRDHYAALAAAWVRLHGKLPPSLEALARWEADVPLEEELAYLEGGAPDPCSKSD